MMRRILAALLLALSLSACSSPATVVHEDQAGWNCSTMGNRVCGTR